MKHNQRAEKLRRQQAGAAKPDHSAALMSVARRFARTDRHLRPIHCHFAKKLIYDTDEIAHSVGQALARLSGRPHFVYGCRASDLRQVCHWHLTTDPLNPKGEPNVQA